MGGTYAQLCFKHAQKNSGADIVYNGSDIREILKLIAKVTGKDIDSSVAEKKESVSGGYELYPKLGYVTLRTSSGCPYKCSYCGWYILGKEFKQEDAGLIVNQIEYFYKKYNIRNFFFL